MERERMASLYNEELLVNNYFVHKLILTKTMLAIISFAITIIQLMVLASDV